MCTYTQGDGSLVHAGDTDRSSTCVLRPLADGRQFGPRTRLPSARPCDKLKLYLNPKFNARLLAARPDPEYTGPVIEKR